MKPRISMITLGVKDLDKSVKFYHEGLGFPIFEASPEVAFFNLNGSWLGLYGYNALAEDAQLSLEDSYPGNSDGNRFNGFALAHNVDSPEKVNQVIEQALSAGAILSKTAQKTFWGGYSGYFKDPDGHLWEIAHNPFFWIGPEDENNN